MTRLDIDFNDVPDEILPIPAGLYLLDVIGTPSIQDVQSKPGNKKIVVEFAVVEGPDGDLEFQNRRVFDNISTKVTTRIKRLALSAGVDISGGLELEDLTGTRLTAKLKENSYTDPITQEARTNTKIADYVIPA